VSNRVAGCCAVVLHDVRSARLPIPPHARCSMPSPTLQAGHARPVLPIVPLWSDGSRQSLQVPVVGQNVIRQPLPVIVAQVPNGDCMSLLLRRPRPEQSRRRLPHSLVNALRILNREEVFAPRRRGATAPPLEHRTGLLLLSAIPMGCLVGEKCSGDQKRVRRMGLGANGS